MRQKVAEGMDEEMAVEVRARVFSMLDSVSPDDIVTVLLVALLGAEVSAFVE